MITKLLREQLLHFHSVLFNVTEISNKKTNDIAVNIVSRFVL